MKRKSAGVAAKVHESAEQVAGAGPPDASSPSRTALKKSSEGLQDLGKELVDASESLLAGLDLPDRLAEAIIAARGMKSFGAKRRQLQFVGKQMRLIDDETVASIRAALDRVHEQSAENTKRLHEAEQWRDALIADDERLSQWIERHPGGDIQALRALIRQARKDAKKTKPGRTQRHGRAYREIFTIVRARLESTEPMT